jgi:hypothetical protein
MALLLVLLQFLLPEYCPELSAKLAVERGSDIGASISSVTSSRGQDSKQQPAELNVPQNKKKMMGAVPGPGLRVKSNEKSGAAAERATAASAGSVEQLLEAADAASLAKALLTSPAVTAAYSNLPQLPLSCNARSAVMYRANKKQLLWDVVLATGVRYSLLVERAGSAAAAASAAEVAPVGDGVAGGSPPWGGESSP